MSPYYLLQCSKCNEVLCKGSLASHTKWIPSRTKIKCPSCGTKQIFENAFETSFNEIFEIIADSSNPMKEAKKILHGLEAIQRGKRVSELEDFYQSDNFQKWIPNSPEKIAAYLAIITAIIMLLKQNPEPKLDINLFMNIYNETVVTMIDKDDQD